MKKINGFMYDDTDSNNDINPLEEEEHVEFSLKPFVF